MATKKQVGGYILDKKIGKGSFAEVWRGKVEATGELVAVKVISRSTVQETAQLKQEVAVLKKLSSPHIVRFRDLKKFIESDGRTSNGFCLLLLSPGRAPTHMCSRLLAIFDGHRCTPHGHRSGPRPRPRHLL
eukprot:g8176.t1